MGISGRLPLSDPTLNYFIRRNAQHHPGHFHYYIHWTGEDGQNAKCPAAYADRLFELYNLITLSLSTKEVMMLGDLLSYPGEFLLEMAREHNVDAMFTYVVTGAVGSGKSSVISHFRSLRQHDEWFEPRMPGMEKQVAVLSPEQLKKIDEWVDAQFALKNRSLYDKENLIGVHILDRGPLDPLAFTSDSRISRRAKKLRAAICTRTKLQRQIVPAHIVLLLADPKEMEIRAKARGKEFDAAALGRQEKDLTFVYGTGAGVTVVDTRGLTVSEIVKRVARVIHNNLYDEVNLTERMELLEESEDQFDLNLE